MRFTQYFLATRLRPARLIIKDGWIELVLANPIRQEIRADGRFRCWAKIPEMEDRALRVILLPDGETVHNAFFDRNFKE